MDPQWIYSFCNLFPVFCIRKCHFASLKSSVTTSWKHYFTHIFFLSLSNFIPSVLIFSPPHLFFISLPSNLPPTCPLCTHTHTQAHLPPSAALLSGSLLSPVLSSAPSFMMDEILITQRGCAVASSLHPTPPGPH